MSDFFKRIRLIPQDQSFLDIITGSTGQININRDTDSLRIYDGNTLGGAELARNDFENIKKTASLDLQSQKNRIRFHWDTLADLESEVDPVVYHGMIAHVHSEGRLYFAHATEWVPVANVSELADVTIPYVPDEDNNLQWVEGIYDFGQNIIKYSNAIQTEVELENYSPVIYHGMTMHVHETGALYYAHAGAWRKLITDTSYNDVVDAGYVDPLGAVAYSNDYNDLTNTPIVFSGDYEDLTNTPTLPSFAEVIGDTYVSGVYDFGDNRILFANVYSNLDDLPDASTYHGMFAHVHATGKAYYAHAGNWVELANQTDIGVPATISSTVLANDSTLLVNAVTGELNTHVLSQVSATNGQALLWNNANSRWQPGDVAADVGSFSFSGTNINTSDSSSITITPATTIQSDLTVENELFAEQAQITNLTLTGNFLSQGSGTPEIVSDNEINLVAGTRVDLTVGPIRMARFTTAERDTLVPQNGDVIYNTTDNKFQGYENGSWANLI